MKFYSKLKSLLRKTSLITLLITFPLVMTWSQTCNKTTGSEQSKSTVEMLSGYIWNGELENIKKLVDENNALVNTRIQNEETMLTIAAWKGYYEIAEYLISKGANLNSRNDWQNTPLHNAAQKGYNDIITLLLDNGAVINAKGTIGNTALCFATENNLTETVGLLLKKGSQVDATNDFGQTPLLMASWSGDTRLIGLLIENGANVNTTDMEGSTALLNLAYGGYAEGIQLVLNAGANVNKADNDGNTALHNAVMNKKPEVVQILLGRMENINLQENRLGNTPLHIAALNGDLKSTELLLNSGAKADIKNFSQKTAFDYAVQYGNVDIVACYIAKSLAPKEALLAARKNQTNGVIAVNNGEAKVVYCGHSGWAIQTEKHVLIFDYWSRNKADQPEMANGSINPQEIKDKDVIVFVSHDHSDHFDSVIYGWKNVVKNITYVYGFKPEDSWTNKETGYHGPEYVYIDDNQTKQIGKIVITTLKSNDSGQGFLVTADGITIYHPGDLAWFSAEDEQAFKKEVDFIAGKTQPIDLAFLPVTGCPSRWQREFVVEGFFYSIDKLNPSQVFPMHTFQREYMMKEFAEMAQKRMVNNQIVCSDNSGDSFHYAKTMVASK